MGLEDYEEAVDRVEKTKEQQRSEAMANTFSLFSVLNQAWNKVNTGAPDSTSRSMSEHITPSDRTDSTGTYCECVVNFIFTNICFFFGLDVSEGRYIKGDPLKGYYDFIITEGSYKFWAVFQVKFGSKLIRKWYKALLF